VKAPDAAPLDAAARRTGQALVALQFGLMALLAALAVHALMAAGGPPGPGRLGLGVVLGLTGLLLGGAAVAANRPGNFNIHPAPRTGGQLVTHGPYRWLRHPMYSAVLLLAAAAALVAASTAALLAWVGLLCTLAAKASLEERWLRQVHPAYAELQARTWRFVPGLF
jgi:protein-S-isoprenylcysteine O-methyltransferase Ste14